MNIDVTINFTDNEIYENYTTLNLQELYKALIAIYPAATSFVFAFSNKDNS